jgi:lactam utilization protein B
MPAGATIRPHSPGKRKRLMNTLRKITALGLFVVAGTAFAQTADPVVNQRQDNQKERIQQGAASGSLSKKEAKRVRAEQRAIATEEKAYKADGKLTKAERKDLTRDQNQASRDIYRQKHDAQVRPPKPAAPQG